MQISLIVATRDRPTLLSRLLQSLRHQRYSNFEVIVVDQSDATNSRLNSIAVSDLAQDITIQHILTETRGLSRARNIGLESATGQWVAFPDDDCWYSEDILDQIATLSEKYPEYSFFSGQYSEPEIINPHFSNHPCVMTSPSSGFDCSSITLFLNRSLIQLNNLRFDEYIGAGTELPAGEECDFLIRVIVAGAVGYYDPAVVIYHQIERQTDERIEQRDRFEKAYGYVVGKHIFVPIIATRIAVGILKLILGVILFRGSLPRLKSQLSGIRLGIKAGQPNGDKNDK